MAFRFLSPKSNGNRGGSGLRLPNKNPKNCERFGPTASHLLSQLTQTLYALYTRQTCRYYPNSDPASDNVDLPGLASPFLLGAIYCFLSCDASFLSSRVLLVSLHGALRRCRFSNTLYELRVPPSGELSSKCVGVKAVSYGIAPSFLWQPSNSQLWIWKASAPTL